MDNDFDKTVERLLAAPCWVVDMLPMQVPQDSKGQFFNVERYYTQETRYELLCSKFADLLLKLNCYHDLIVNCNTSDEWVKNPKPAVFVEWLTECLHHGHLCIHVDGEDALITVMGGDTYISLYNPNDELLQLIQKLASATGLFLWQPKENQ